MIKNIKTFIIVTLYIVIGLVIITIGSVWREDRVEFIKNAIKMQAIVTERELDHRGSDGTEHYRYYMTYTVDGKQYRKMYTINYSDDWMETIYIGKLVNIYYNPENPSDCRGGFGYGEYIFWGIGGIFLLIAVFLIYSSIYRPHVAREKIKYLKENGIRIEAELKNVDLKGLIDLGGVGYVIPCVYFDPNTNKTYEFVSEEIWFDKKKINPNYSIKTIPVYVDKDDFTKYYVDIEAFKEYLGYRD